MSRSGETRLINLWLVQRDRGAVEWLSVITEDTLSLKLLTWNTLPTTVAALVGEYGFNKSPVHTVETDHDCTKAVCKQMQTPFPPDRVNNESNFTNSKTGGRWLKLAGRGLRQNTDQKWIHLSSNSDKVQYQQTYNETIWVRIFVWVPGNGPIVWKKTYRM